MKYLFIVAAFTLYSLFGCSTLPSEFNDALDGFSDEIAEQEFSADVDENTAADLIIFELYSQRRINRNAKMFELEAACESAAMKKKTGLLSKFLRKPRVYKQLFESLLLEQSLPKRDSMKTETPKVRISENIEKTPRGLDLLRINESAKSCKKRRRSISRTKSLPLRITTVYYETEPNPPQ